MLDQRKRLRIEGTKNLMTDEKGIAQIEELKRRYCGKNFRLAELDDEEKKSDKYDVGMRKSLRLEWMSLLQRLRAEGRLWQRGRDAPAA